MFYRKFLPSIPQCMEQTKRCNRNEGSSTIQLRCEARRGEAWIEGEGGIPMMCAKIFSHQCQGQMTTITIFLVFQHSDC